MYLNALATDFGSTGVTGSMRTAIAAPMAAACSAELASWPPAALAVSRTASCQLRDGCLC